MNFNRRDSLNITDVLDDPQFLAFLRKWEINRNQRDIQAIFASNFSFFCRTLFFHWVSFTNFSFIFLSFHNFPPQNHLHELADSESPALSLVDAVGHGPTSPDVDGENDDLPNQISASYEVPQFPIEQIEKKLMLQRHLTAKWVDTFNYLFLFYEFDPIRCTIAVIIRVKFRVVT